MKLCSDGLAMTLGLFDKDHAKILTRFSVSSRAQEAVNALAQGAFDQDGDDALYAGCILMNFGKCLAEDANGYPEELRAVLPILHAITRTLKHNLLTQFLSSAVIEFWREFLMWQDYEWVRDQLQGLAELVMATTLPKDGHGELEKPLLESPFGELRSEVRLILQDLDDSIASATVEMFLDTAIRGINHASWSGTSAFLEALLAFDRTYVWQFDELVESLFSSNLFADLAVESSGVPQLLRKQAIQLLGRWNEVVVRNADTLRMVIGSLLASLQSPNFELQSAAAASTAEIARRHKSKLVPYAEEFIQHAFKSLDSLFDLEAIEEVIEAMASVSTAIESPSKKADMFKSLMNLAENRRKTQSQVVGEYDSTVNCLKGIHAIVRATRDPRPLVFDLDEITEKSCDKEAVAIFSAMRKDIAWYLAELIRPFRTSGYVLELVCNILSEGYMQNDDDPFHFAPSVTVEVITSTPLDNHRLDVAFRAASDLVLKTGRGDIAIQDVVSILLEYTHRVVVSGVPENDPEVAAACLEFFGNLVSHYLPVFVLNPMQKDQVFDILRFANLCIEKPESFSKKAACSVWEQVLEVKVIPAQQRLALSELIESLTPALLDVIVFNIGGGAPRVDDVRDVCGPLRKLKGVHGLEGRIVSVLSQPNCPAWTLDIAKRKRVASQIMLVRGSVKIYDVTKEFWQVCRDSDRQSGWSAHNVQVLE